MTPEVPITGQESRLHDDSENDENHASAIEQQDSRIIFVETGDKSDAATASENQRLWCLEDFEGVVMELLADIAIGSAGQSMENVISKRLFTYVAAWSSSIFQEILVSAIAPTGDLGVDSNDVSVLEDSRVLLGRSNAPAETLDSPKSCPIDASYQPKLIPIRTPKRDHYDNESLHHVVKSATRSHARPASVTSSRLTAKSKMRKKQHGASSAQIELTGPQPGVPYSTETRENLQGHTSNRHQLVSPRKTIAAHHVVATTNVLGPPWDTHFNNSYAAAGLQLNVDTETLRHDNSVGSSRTRRSPPPLSNSPSSITSARRRPHPPGSAHRVQPAKVLCFGEREEEVKVEYAVQNLPSQRNSVSAKSVLPDISCGRITPRPSFRVFSSSNNVGGDNEKESLFDEDPLEQHFYAMPLSPGVKVQAGDESNDGPDLPLFASRMRRSTFAHMHTCTLPASNLDAVSPRTPIPTNQHQTHPLKATFITETAWDLGLSSSDRTHREGQVVPHGRIHYLAPECWSGDKSEDLSSAEPTASCSCSTSNSLVRNEDDSDSDWVYWKFCSLVELLQTLFRRQSRVQRPCRSCSNSKPEPTRTKTINFTSVIKQRAFHLKPPCLPTSSSPSKRAPGTSPRRITSAPASSRTLIPSSSAELHDKN